MVRDSGGGGGGEKPSRSSWRAAVKHWLAGTSLGQELSGSLGDLGTFLPLVVRKCTSQGSRRLIVRLVLDVGGSHDAALVAGSHTVCPTSKAPHQPKTLPLSNSIHRQLLRQCVIQPSGCWPRRAHCHACTSHQQNSTSELPVISARAGGPVCNHPVGPGHHIAGQWPLQCAVRGGVPDTHVCAGELRSTAAVKPSTISAAASHLSRVCTSRLTHTYSTPLCRHSRSRALC